MDLVGDWQAALADDDLRRRYADPEFDDRDWAALPVPAHWRTTSAFADSDGPLLYRRRFDHPVPEGDRRLWLTFDGLFYQGDIWLDGAYLGDTEGYFAPDTFEITEQLAARGEHTLAVEVTCSPQRDKAAKRNLTGVFQHWDCLDDTWNPGGIWRPVRIEETGPVRIRDMRVLCGEATADRATVLFRANLETAEPRSVVVRSAVGGVDHEVVQPLAAGQNNLEWGVTIDQPDLWWPWSLGSQPMHEVVVEVAPEEAPDRISHRRTCRTGLRQVELRGWIFSVNGERLYLKGSNQGPTRHALADATEADFATDVRLAREAGLDLLRVHAHISRSELYDQADEQGILLWQDMPLQWGYARTVRKQAARQSNAAVRLLGHHPSVAIWCGHNEPLAVSSTEVGLGKLDLAKAGARFFVGNELPTFNRTFLDRTIARTLRRADGTRPVIPHSGVWPHLPQLDGTDTHVYFGWYHNRERDFPRFLAAIPRMARFVTEFGAQAIPATADFMEPEKWPHLDWDRITTEHKIQKTLFDRHVPPGDFDTFDDWRDATQRYQALVIDRHIRELRRIKYRPNGGFAQFAFADAAPLVSWSVLDHERVPKLGYEALQRACAPVIVVADRLPATMRPGEAIALDVHVVSDLRVPLPELECTATLTWEGGSHRWRFAGDVGADDVARVGTLQLEAPATPGPLGLHLEVVGLGLAAPVTDTDTTIVRP